jgi:hypothetical protein
VLILPVQVLHLWSELQDTFGHNELLDVFRPLVWLRLSLVIKVLYLAHCRIEGG